MPARKKSSTVTPALESRPRKVPLATVACSGMESVAMEPGLVMIMWLRDDGQSAIQAVQTPEPPRADGAAGRAALHRNFNFASRNGQRQTLLDSNGHAFTNRILNIRFRLGFSSSLAQTSGN